MKITLENALISAKNYFAKSETALEISFEVAEGFTAFINRKGYVTLKSAFDEDGFPQ